MRPVPIYQQCLINGEAILLKVDTGGLEHNAIKGMNKLVVYQTNRSHYTPLKKPDRVTIYFNHKKICYAA